MMAETVTMEPTASEAAELRAEIDRMLAEIDQLRDKMRRDDVEIELSRKRTQAILADLQLMFQQW
jgi:molecular chaperone GrpE (heat shock protein)